MSNPRLRVRHFDPSVVDAYTELDPTALVELPDNAGLVGDEPPL